MTTPRYPMGCAAGSQEREGAPNPSDYAVGVNFNNGNVNGINRNNNGFARACRRVAAGEDQDAKVTLQQLHAAMKSARRKKKPSANQAAFDVRWMDGLIDLRERLNAYAWSPAPSICFIASKPKAREIHAPDFGDRVVHHWLVPQLEAVFERAFIFDSFSNRTGKGTHAAVNRLRTFVREVHSGQGGGHYLQLDIHNFFNSIHRPTLYAQLKRGMQRARLPLVTQHAVHALLRHAPGAAGVLYRATAAERAQVPLHKRLENAAPGCGLPIGNLSSQFFANVYLNELDQFVKHVLKVKRYVRYVDDFVLVHESREQLQVWQRQIETFLAERLRLKLKADVKLAPLTTGIDFLGYVLFPTHTRVRRRVVQHAREKLGEWARGVDLRRDSVTATPEQLLELQAIWRSYEGHFTHANAWKLRGSLHARMPWLAPLTSVNRRFHHRMRGRCVSIPIKGVL